MKILMTGGGTGGHINPAIAIADTFRRHNPDCEIAFVGTPKGMENKIVPAAGYELYHVNIKGLRRSVSIDTLKTLGLMISSQFEAEKIIKDFKPELVIGTGGYVCWPMVNKAASKGILTALHESNAVPGAAIKMLQNKVDKIYVNFEETKQQIKNPGKVLRVGNPLRDDFSLLTQDEARKTLGFDGKYRKVILSCGGSLGAERINLECLKLMRDYTSKHPEIKHIHASGSIEWQESQRLFAEYNLDKFPNLELVEYIYDMPLKMAAADLVINRAGAMTLSELAMQGKPCVLIPSPNVTNDHQFKNGKVLADSGAALEFRESELEEGVLTNAVSTLIENREKLRIMGENIKKFAIPDSAEIIYSDLMNFLESRKKTT